MHNNEKWSNILGKSCMFGHFHHYVWKGSVPLYYRIHSVKGYILTGKNDLSPSIFRYDNSQITQGFLDRTFVGTWKFMFIVTSKFHFYQLQIIWSFMQFPLSAVLQLTWTRSWNTREKQQKKQTRAINKCKEHSSNLTIKVPEWKPRGYFCVFTVNFECIL